MIGISGVIDFNKNLNFCISQGYNESLFKSQGFNQKNFNIKYLNKSNFKSHFSYDKDFFLCLGELIHNDKIYNGTRASKLLFNYYKKNKLKNFIKKNGNFIFLIKNSKNIIIGKNESSIIPLYYYKKNSRFLFCFDKLNLKKNINGNIEINFHKIGQEFLTGGIILDNDTIFKSIKFLQNGEILKIDNCQIRSTILNYFSYNPSYKNLEYHLNNCAVNLDKAIKRISKIKTVQVGLSGGIDSRILVSFLKKNNYSINSFTCGMKNFDEAIIAKNVAEHFDIKFSGITINEKDYLADIFKSLKISCFNGNINSFPKRIIFKKLGKKYKESPFVFGTALDCTLGDAWQRDKILKIKNMKNFVDFYRKEHVFKFSIKNFKKLFHNKKLAENIYEDALEKIKLNLNRISGESFFDINSSFFFECRGKKWYNQLLVYPLHYTNIKSPFYDNEFLMAVSKVPFFLRKNDFFRVKFLEYINKEISLIPYNKTMRRANLIYPENKIMIAHQKRLEKIKFLMWLKNKKNKKNESTRHDANLLEWLIKRGPIYRQVRKYFSHKKNILDKTFNVNEFKKKLELLKFNTNFLGIILMFVSKSIYVDFIKKDLKKK